MRFLLLSGAACALLAASAAAQDLRKVVPLTPLEREFVLTEMRSFLQGLQRMTDAAAREDFTALASAARAMGMAEMKNTPPAISEKLPPEFKQLARGVHQGFDTIAADADARKDTRYTLAQLSGVLQQCHACHSTFRFP